MTESIEARAAKWAAGRDTGVSSKTIMAFMLNGTAPDPGYPHDASDLKRCLALLEAVPEWEPRLGELSALPGVNGQCWKALAEKWDMLKVRAAGAAGISEDKRYEFVTSTMREILHPIEDASGQVARIGKNASITCSPDSAFGKAVINHAKKHGGKGAAVRAKHSLEDGEKAVKAVSDMLDGKVPEGSNTADVGGVSGQRLKSFMERIERMEEEKAGLADDIKDVYAEAKGVGFDTKTIRKIIRLRKMDKEKRREEEELLELYKAAVGID